MIKFLSSSSSLSSFCHHCLRQSSSFTFCRHIFCLTWKFHHLLQMKFTPNPIPYSHTCPVATCNRTWRFELPLVHPSLHSTRVQSLMSNSLNATCCSRTAFDYWSNPFGSNTRVYYSCLDYIDCTDYARNYTTHDSAHRTMDYVHLLVAWSVVMVSSWWMSWSLVASNCHLFVLIADLCSDKTGGELKWCQDRCL